MQCAGCGRPLRFRQNQSAGRCPKDRAYECYHCTTLEKKCVFCQTRTRDIAGGLLWGGLFMAILMGSIVGPLTLPQAFTNAHLDSFPTTPLSSVEPGGTYKVFATVASNQSDVIHGYWTTTSNGNQKWAWTAHNFWITQGATSLFVDVSSLIDVREPGSAWGSASGSAMYTAGSPIAIYGTSGSSSNGTTLFAQYVAPTPTAMGRVGGDIWPLTVGTIIGPALIALVGGLVWRRQRRQHREFLALHPPRIPPAHSSPESPVGVRKPFLNTELQTKFRRSWVQTAVTAPLLVVGALSTFVNYFLGIFIVSFAGVFLFASFSNRSSYAKVPITFFVDDGGVTVEPFQSRRYVDDRYFPWTSVKNCHVYFGATLALRTDRGEFRFSYLPKGMIAALLAEFQGRGIPVDEPSAFHPMVGAIPRWVPLPALAPSDWQRRVEIDSRRMSLSVGLIMALTVGLVCIPGGFFLLSASVPFGLAFLVAGLAGMIASGVLSVRLRRLMATVAPGDEHALFDPTPKTTEATVGLAATGHAPPPSAPPSGDVRVLTAEPILTQRGSPAALQSTTVHGSSSAPRSPSGSPLAPPTSLPTPMADRHSAVGFCPACGQPRARDASFCGSCGGRLPPST